MKKQPEIKAIIFDLGGVVMHSGFKDLINRYCASCLTRAGKKKIHELEHKFNVGGLSERQFFDSLHNVFGVHLSDKKMHDYIVKHMKTDAELIKMIPKLKKAKIAILSNALGAITTQVLLKRGLRAKELFDKVFLSNKMHIIKPDARAYHYVAEKLGVEPHEALMVDDRKENVDGAKKAGMQAVRYKNAGQFKKALERYEIVPK